MGKTVLQAVVLAGAVVLGGCAGLGDVDYDNDTLAIFADDYFGKAKTSEARLLRSHAIIGGLARYGARTIAQHKEHERTTAIADAVVLLDRLGRAKILLDHFHGILMGAAGSKQAQLIKTELPEYGRAIAISEIRAEIIRVAKDAIGPRWNRTRGLATRIFTGGWPAGLLTNVGDIISALRDLAKTKKLGKALISSIKSKVEAIDNSYLNNKSTRKSDEDKAWKAMRALIETSEASLKITAEKK
ncbi:MAG: hypothetical protein IIC55_07390 [Proteobacteria bacterium]|nr:hypothetical protein [Pseudomonadota bacterium]